MRFPQLAFSGELSTVEQPSPVGIFWSTLLEPQHLRTEKTNSDFCLLVHSIKFSSLPCLVGGKARFPTKSPNN